MYKPITIKEALDVHERSVSFREAEILLGWVLGVSREILYQSPEMVLEPEIWQKYIKTLEMREKNIPIAYITGSKEFFGHPFKCDQRALIPRPETEALVEEALAYLNRSELNTLSVLELGTGSGNIAISLALGSPKPIKIIATDISPEALDLAKENEQSLVTNNSSANQIKFVQADLFNHPEIKKCSPYNLILANLPYVPESWRFDPQAQPEVIFYEPAVALFGGEEGTQLFPRFFQKVGPFLAEKGEIWLEIGDDEGEFIQNEAQKYLPKKKATLLRDYAGLVRYLNLK
jgi:release factor glutamine methyltransferase